MTVFFFFFCRQYLSIWRGYILDRDKPKPWSAPVCSLSLSPSTAAFLSLFSLPPADTSSSVSQQPPPESLWKSFGKHSCASSTSRLSASADTDPPPPPPHPPTHPPAVPALASLQTIRHITNKKKISPLFTHLRKYFFFQSYVEPTKKVRQDFFQKVPETFSFFLIFFPPPTPPIPWFHMVEPCLGMACLWP